MSYRKIYDVKKKCTRCRRPRYSYPSPDGRGDVCADCREEIIENMAVLAAAKQRTKED